MATLKQLSYLSAGKGSFWTWSDDGTVIVWADNDTIAFTDELKGYLARFAGRGLPSLDSFLLILAATRSSWPQRSAKLSKVLAAEHLETLGLLDRVHKSSIGHCESQDDRAGLLFLLLDRVHCSVDSEVAGDVMALLNASADEAFRQQLQMLSLGYTAPERLLERALTTLRPALNGFTAESLQLRRETGVSALPEAPESITLTDAEQARALLKSLQAENTELSRLARLATQLMSVVSLPRNLGSRDERPIGGVSDISNRGSLDRLLISELAHDDLTLAVRVATNEAMYLRRESPPSSPPKRRAVLLDTGIRTWGIPRVYIAATGLAFLATSDNSAELDIRSLTREGAVDANLATEDGLKQHMSLRSPHLFPEEALDEEMQSWQQAESDAATPIFVTTPETMADEMFLQRIRGYLSAGLLVVTVSRRGEFELTEWSVYGSKLLRTAQFELEEILPDREELIDEESLRDMPAIFRAQSFPLLLGPPVNSDNNWYLLGVGGFQITRDGRLLFSESKQHGARQLCEGVGELVWSARQSIDDHVFAVANHPTESNRRQLISVELGTKATTVTDFEVDAKAFFEHNRQLYSVSEKVVHRICLESAAIRQSMKLPDGVYWQKGKNSRFFYRFEKAKLSWYCLAGGPTLSLQSVVPKGNTGIRVLFEMPSIDGIMAVDSADTIIDVDTGKAWMDSDQTREHKPFQYVARSGRFLVYGTTHQYHLKPLPHMEAIRVHRVWHHTQTKLIEPGVMDVFSVRSLRARLSAVGFCPGVGLILRSKGNKLLGVHLVNGVLKVVKQEPDVHVRGLAPFRPIEAAHGRRLSVATFDNGDQVFLDRRGLLHLKSCDVGIPESTLVLNDSNVAGWLSTGEVFGSKFFHGGLGRETSPTDAFRQAILPFVLRGQGGTS